MNGRSLGALGILSAGIVTVCVAGGQEVERRWIAGDPHVHSKWSLDYDESKDPPTPIYDDAIYSIPRNAEMGSRFGLKWIVATDHGGPDHAMFNRQQAYPDLLASRRQFPDLIQYYGLEWNTPGMDHHAVIVPIDDAESQLLFEIESRFDKAEKWPKNPERDTVEARRAALEFMRKLPRPPLVFANHPGRTAAGLGQWGQTEPLELRQNMDAAPEVYRGMEGAPGHQAKPLSGDGRNARGSYGRRGAQTLGGFDQAAAVLGGLWDSMLGEGRRFWITAGSDSHIHHTETKPEGDDFWPGEFQKTYVLAAPTADDIFDGLKSGRVFVVAGDLISELDVMVSADGRRAGAGETLDVAAGAAVRVEIRFRDPDGTNARGDHPQVARVDLIVGDVERRAGQSLDRNPSTRVAARFTAAEWSSAEGLSRMETTLPATRSFYVRVRGTSTQTELEPAMDPIGENPWTDLWFYSNPVFVNIR
jgi:hypothetical protein